MALKHTYEKAFSIENGMRRNVPKVVVAITDGRSQDEVKKSAAKLQHAGNVLTRSMLYHQNILQYLSPHDLLLYDRLMHFCVPSSGYSVFSIGVADVDFVELQEIGSKPSERHVFVVDDFDAFDTIKENLITFICETATSSKFAQYPLQLNSQESIEGCVQKVINVHLSCSTACPLIFLNGFTSPGTCKQSSAATTIVTSVEFFQICPEFLFALSCFRLQDARGVQPDREDLQLR